MESVTFILGNYQVSGKSLCFDFWFDPKLLVNWWFANKYSLGVKQDGSVSHFFHRAIKAYNTGTRKRRKIHGDDCGDVRWHKTGRTKPVILDGVQKGCKKIMVLYMVVVRGGKPEKTNWVMHQYHLGTEEDEKDGEYVISKIFFQQHQVKQGEKADQDISESVDASITKVDPVTPKSQTPEPPRNEHSDFELGQDNTVICPAPLALVNFFSHFFICILVWKHVVYIVFCHKHSLIQRFKFLGMSSSIPFSSIYVALFLFVWLAYMIYKYGDLVCWEAWILQYKQVVHCNTNLYFNIALAKEILIPTFPVFSNVLKHTEFDYIEDEVQPECEIPGHYNQQKAENQPDQLLSQNENCAPEDPKWWDSESQNLLDSQQLVEGLSLCDDLLQSQSPNRDTHANGVMSKGKFRLSDYAQLGAEDLKKDLEECQNLVLDQANIDLDTPPEFRLSQLVSYY